ncbi:MAG: sigma-70 family RNA polymerase sigma factor [Gemmataceae bacterium]
MIDTPRTLLVQLREGTDPNAWGRFDTLYRPLITSWVRAYGIPSVDVEEIVGKVFDSVLNVLRKDFEYDSTRGKFRQYLGKSVRFKAYDYFRKHGRRAPHVTFDENTAPAMDPFDEAMEQEHRTHILRYCLDLARQRVDGDNWQLFLDFYLHGRPAKELASIHRISEQAVYNRVHRVMTMVRQVARDLDPDLWPKL